MTLAKLTSYAFALSMSLSLSAYLQAANVKVNCNKNHATISAALKLLKPEETNVVTVSGHCKENVLIQGFDRLTLITNTSARIDDASGGTDNVVAILDSRRVTAQGFRIKGGLTGILCADASVCYLTSNTVESSLGDGVFAFDSRVFLDSNMIQNNAGRGMFELSNASAISSRDTYRGNADSGVRVLGSYFLCSGSTVQNNGSNGAPGIVGGENSTLRFGSCTITGNTSDGVALAQSSAGRFGGLDVITGNGGSGVSLGDLTYATFNVGENITGNLGGTDVLCNPQFSATRGALTNINGGITNCVEPAGGRASQDKSDVEIRHWESLVGGKLRSLRATH